MRRQEESERTIGDNNRLGRRIITAFAARLHRNSLLLLLFRVAVNFITVNGALDMDTQINRFCDFALRCVLGYVRIAHYLRLQCPKNFSIYPGGSFTFVKCSIKAVCLHVSPQNEKMSFMRKRMMERRGREGRRSIRLHLSPPLWRRRRWPRLLKALWSFSAVEWGRARAWGSRSPHPKTIVSHMACVSELSG